MCKYCLEKSENPLTECFEVSCKCECHLSVGELMEQEKINYENENDMFMGVQLRG